MHTEYEVKVLEVDSDSLINKIEQLGGTKVGEFNYRRYVYDFNPKRNDEWIRLRTDGNNTTLTYKNITNDKIDGTKELEIVVDNFDRTNEMLEVLGYSYKGYQENKRIRYMLDGVEIDFDSWPMIPTYMEIEGKNNDEVVSTIGKLGINKERVTAMNTQDIYLNYGIVLDGIKELRFDAK